MKPIRVQKSQSIADIEELYNRLFKAAIHCDVQLPTHLKNEFFGGSCALIQFLITWAKRHPKDRLITHVQVSEDPVSKLASLTDQDHGLVAVLLADQVVRGDGSSSIKEQADLAAGLRLNQIFEEGIASSSPGQQVLLLCADHVVASPHPADPVTKSLPLFRHSYQNHFLFYHRTSQPSVRGVRDFQRLAEELFQQATPEKVVPLPEEEIRYIGVILCELFKNTHQWARHDTRGRLLDRSVRGIQCRFVHYYKDVLLGSVVNDAVLHEYVKNDFFPAQRGWTAFAEISIFDSGPGLAQRKKGEAFRGSEGLQEEYEWVYRCMQLHATSGESHHGRGLHEVLLHLTGLRGFLRIRTGRLGLQRDLVRHPYEGKAQPDLYDWVRDDQCFTKLQRAEGTAITILIPVQGIVKDAF